ncbi:putative 5-formyltetrahydrofolate cyclo-ligase [Selenomonas ruminantium subsp. lactilytica TAM6421]|uniref:5-formyltetrahydrofolate cyclo-ligase n=1 Tax=Selenomonas ruminantium subsp. lactilytica (strain NBRC 103574 / TAM6421) TaxID=927704 RepID=I0GNX8_SELRL|nr:5-formyltetrahydrofolate cyclo-ligase [Selenomonas ruminantium]BAL82465.1 putative 5-formyltetrahydrofolate cyclo-ligase [Selenomonas ruminantium subsp. lactilytica TAM6421]
MDGVNKELQAEKKALRSKILAARRELKEAYRQKASQRMIDVFCALPDFKAPKTVLCYASMADEVQLKPLVERFLAAGVTVAMPHVIGKGQMEAVTLASLDNLVEGEYGILTPDLAKGKVVPPEQLDLIIVPGVAFDTRGERLGMGAGFYDAYIAQAVNAKRVALAYSCQLVADVPMEEHDVLVHKIITEQGIYNCLL